MSVSTIKSQIQFSELQDFLSRNCGDRVSAEGVLLRDTIFSIVQKNFYLPEKASVHTVLQSIDPYLCLLDPSTIDSVKSAISTFFQTSAKTSLPEASVQKKQKSSEEQNILLQEISPDIWSHISQFLSDKDKFSLAQVSCAINQGVRSQSTFPAHKLCTLFSLNHPQFRTLLGDVDLSQTEERVKISKSPQGAHTLALYDNFVSKLQGMYEALNGTLKPMTGLQVQNPIWVSRLLSEVSPRYEKALDIIIATLSSRVPEEFRKKLARIPPQRDVKRCEEIQKVFTEIARLPLIYLELVDLPIMPQELFLLTNLEGLWIEGGTFFAIPREIGNLKNLRSLTIYRTPIQTLPPEIGGLESLSDLFLHDNALTFLPPEVGNLKNLSNLGLANNSLKRLPPEIGRLAKLEVLCAHGNKLEELPPEIENLVRLVHIILSENQLLSIPPQIGSLINLASLELQKNKITSLPFDMGRLVNLGYIDLRDNPIRSLPQELRRLGHLQILGDTKKSQWSSSCVMQ